MAATVKNILETLNLDAPFNLAESWDNVGLLVGSSTQQVTGIMIGLDPTIALIQEAIDSGCNTVVTHHPVIFKPLAAIKTDTTAGILLEKALTNRIAIIGCHTNFDSAEEGVSSYLAAKLGLDATTPLVPSPAANDNQQTGLGRIGTYAAAVNGEEFLKKLLAVLEVPGVQVTARLPEKITTVALCGGSGSDLAPLAHERGADVYLSAEIKHATAIWANENDFCIIDGTHYATEKPAVKLLVDKLQHQSEKNNWNITVLQSTRERHPYTFMDTKYKTLTTR
ncbi:Nif3-like dinuclear metal center hexameric protein [Desulforhopalus singaporensis]|uniref:GTP cyclohydrolase 1 type 2 homolog n=1 Tax=Desulforhopalus singaporensis TaxID=91360 RepID=A0A1H0S8Q8_9BACT|nr:Nif3-like dinuclear metal center hexameric protein [Desulforhopalus singaporensis]SDP37889.1 dinuclear metal center protein, YbgI/SA1388 family [Desulforhopalus singaporensis]